MDRYHLLFFIFSFFEREKTEKEKPLSEKCNEGKFWTQISRIWNTKPNPRPWWMLERQLQTPYRITSTGKILKDYLITKGKNSIKRRMSCSFFYFCFFFFFEESAPIFPKTSYFPTVPYWILNLVITIRFIDTITLSMVAHTSFGPVEQMIKTTLICVVSRAKISIWADYDHSKTYSNPHVGPSLVGTHAVNGQPSSGPGSTTINRPSPMGNYYLVSLAKGQHQWDLHLQILKRSNAYGLGQP